MNKFTKQRKASFFKKKSIFFIFFLFFLFFYFFKVMLAVSSAFELLTKEEVVESEKKVESD